jgi:L-ribulose-5-phosphate 4-epimerase
MILDGVIKYSLHHVTAPLIEVDSSELKHWFKVCRGYNLLGQDSERYDGAAYGNISQKLDQGFIITGTQVSGLDEINKEHLCWVTQVDAANNQVYSTLYDADSAIQAIIHVHSPELWARDLPSTSPDIAYGTPEMAEAVAELLKDPKVRDLGCIRMGGHEDGILFFSENMTKTGEKVVQIMEKS